MLNFVFFFQVARVKDFGQYMQILSEKVFPKNVNGSFAQHEQQVFAMLMREFGKINRRQPIGRHLITFDLPLSIGLIFGDAYCPIECIDDYGHMLDIGITVCISV